jgi:Short C-terminal domain
MKISTQFIALILALVSAGCALPPSSDPSKVDSECAQQCSGNLATCSSGFKLFPIVQQKQCNDTYDVCIKGCPARTAQPSATKPTPQTTAERLKKLDELFNSGAITKSEYEAKRKEILGSL